MFIAFRVVGMAGKPPGVFIGVKFTIPQTRKIAHFSGCMGTKSRLMNVLEWEFNYEILSIIYSVLGRYHVLKIVEV